MDIMPLFGFGFFILLLVCFFQNVHKETLEEMIKDLKKELLNERNKNNMMAKVNEDLFSEIHKDTFFANPKELDKVVENNSKQ